MLDYISTTIGLKYILGIIGSFLVMLGYSIEPSSGIWIISMGGTLLTASFGKDRSLHAIILYIFIGLGWGIFGSQLFISIFPILPQKATAFFAAMFGAESTSYVILALREGSITEIIIKFIENFRPINFGKEK